MAGEGPTDGTHPKRANLARRRVLAGGGSVALAAVGVPGAGWLLRDGHRHAGRRPPVSPVSLVATLTPPVAAATGPEGYRDDDVEAVAFSPDGRTLACGHASGTVRLWDVGTRRPVRTLRGSRMIVCLAFSPDGRVLACGSGGDGGPPARLWDLATGHRTELPGSGWVVFSPDGRLLAVADGGDRIRLWRMSPSRPREAAVLRVAARTDFVAFSPGGATLACGGGEMGHLGMQLWEVASRTRKSTYVIPRRRGGGPERVVALGFDPAGRPLALDDGGGVWDIAAGRRAATLPVGGTLDGLGPAGLSPDGRTVAGVTMRVVRFFDLSTGRLLAMMDRPGSFGGWQVAFTRDSALVAVASGFRVQLYRLRRGR